jgi:outer membrane lipoprotein SlyB
MALPSTQTVLSVLAMIALGALGGLLIYQAVPPANVQLLTFILGAIAGAVTGGAAVWAADTAKGASDAA